MAQPTLKNRFYINEQKHFSYLVRLKLEIGYKQPCHLQIKN